MKAHSTLLWTFFLALAIACRRLPDLSSSLALIIIYAGCITCIILNRKKPASVKSFLGSGFQFYIIIAYATILLFNIFTSQARHYSEYDVALIAILPITFIVFTILSSNQQLQNETPLQFLWPTAAVAIFSIVQAQIEQARAPANFLDINSFAAFMYLALLPTAGHLMASKKHWLHWPFLVLTCLALSVADSRGAYLAVILGIGVLCVIGIILKLPHRRIVAVTTICILSCSVGATTLAAKRNFNFLQTIGSPEQTLHADTISVHSRLWMWDSALNAYKTEAPVLGTGLGTYKLIYPKYRDPREKYSSGDQTHNDYIQWLLEGGPLLLAGLILVAVAIPVNLLVRGIRKSAFDLFSAWPAIYLAITCLAIAGHATINFLYKDPVIALLVGTYLARSTCLTANTIQDEKVLLAGTFTKLIPTGTALIVAFIVAILGINTAIHFAFINPESGAKNWSAQKTYSAAALAHLLSPSNPYALNALSSISLEQAMATDVGAKRTALLNASYVDTRLWIESNRRDPFAWMRAAQIAALDKAVTKGITPEDFLRIAAAYDPTSLPVNTELGRQLLDLGYVAESCSTMRGAEKWVPIAVEKVRIKQWAQMALLACKGTASEDEVAIWNSIVGEP